VAPLFGQEEVGKAHADIEATLSLVRHKLEVQANIRLAYFPRSHHLADAYIVIFLIHPPRLYHTPIHTEPDTDFVDFLKRE
jgi:hypothetical protein